jgi:hypothetical protein
MDSVVHGGSVVNHGGGVVDYMGSCVMDSVVGSSVVNSMAGSTKVGESCESHIGSGSAEGNEGDQGKCLQNLLPLQTHFKIPK